jgi:hypothetical protein
MLRLLVIILVMLIPLRGWSAERMAVQMAFSQAIVDSVGEQVSMVDMPDDCPTLAQAKSTAEKSSSSFKGSTGCQACQLCVTLASSSFLQTPLTACLTEGQPESAGIRFISANVAPQIRPPIL